MEHETTHNTCIARDPTAALMEMLWNDNSYSPLFARNCLSKLPKIQSWTALKGQHDNLLFNRTVSGGWGWTMWQKFSLHTYTVSLASGFNETVLIIDESLVDHVMGIISLLANILRRGAGAPQPPRSKAVRLFLVPCLRSADFRLLIRPCTTLVDSPCCLFFRHSKNVRLLPKFFNSS